MSMTKLGNPLEYAAAHKLPRKSAKSSEIGEVSLTYALMTSFIIPTSQEEQIDRTLSQYAVTAL